MPTKITAKQRAARKRNIEIARRSRYSRKKQVAKKVIAHRYKTGRRQGESKSAAMFKALHAGGNISKAYAMRKAYALGKAEAKQMGLTSSFNVKRIGKNYAGSVRRNIKTRRRK
mgnify:CR=1 FL=1